MAKKAAKQQAAATSTGVSFFQRNIYVWCIAAFAVVLYANSLFNGYNMDDELVTRNHRLTAKGISALPEIFTSPYYEDNMGYAYEYRPVVLATFAIEHTLFGEHAGVSHFINLLLYIALCIAVFYYVRQLKGVITPFLALVAALIFVAHPSHTEVVSSIKNRDEILGLLFSLLASLTALRAARQGNWWAILLTVLWFALAMLSKSTFVPFAFFIPLSLILFSPATLAYTVVLTLPLAAITYAVLDINPLHLKLWLVLALPAAVAAMHILIKGFNPAPLRALFNQPAAENTLPDAPFSGLQAWYSGFNAASLIGLLPVLIILPVYALLCVGTGWALVLGAGVLLSGVVAHVVRFRYWNLSLAFTVAAIIAGIETVGRVDIGRDNSLILEVFYVLLYFQFFWGRASVRLAAVVLVPFVAYYLSSSYLTGDIFDTFLLFLFGRLMVGKNLLRGVLVIFAGFVAYSVFSVIKSPADYAVDFTATTKLAFILFTLYGTRVWPSFVQKLDTVIAWAATLLLLVFALRYQPQAALTLQTDHDYFNVVEAVVEKPIDRPLQFIEIPVSGQNPQTERIGTALTVLGHYFTKTLVPYPLSFYYGYAFIQATPLSSPAALFWLLVHGVLLLAALWWLRTRPAAAYGLLLYLLSVLLYSGYFKPVPGMVADRYLLLPTLGFALCAALLLFELFKVPQMASPRAYLQGRPPLTYVLLVYLLLSAGLTTARNFNWKDDLTLMRHDIGYVNNSSQAHNLLALHLMQHAEAEPAADIKTQMRQEALGQFKKAIEIYPPFFNVAFDIGRTFNALGQADSALLYFQKAIQIDSTYVVAYQFAGDILTNLKRYDEAIPYLQFEIRQTPAVYDPYSKLSYIYFLKTDYPGSIAVNKQALQAMPGNVNALINIAQVFRSQQQPDSALYYLQLAQKADPQNVQVQAGIAEMSHLAKP